jgi:hypothetical protein
MPSRDELTTTLWDLVEQLYRMETPSSKADAYLSAPVFAVPVMLTFKIPFAAATTQGVVRSWLGWWGVAFAWCWLFLQLAYDLANASFVGSFRVVPSMHPL